MKKHFIGTGHAGRLRNSLEDEIPEINILICEHEGYCPVINTLNKAHCSLDYAKECQPAK
ncbi:hypothetical protein LCGC14_1854570, partial [marine sediment metagenome]